MKKWYRCYHSSKYPIITFDHIENDHLIESRVNFTDAPNANSTMIEPRDQNILNASRIALPSDESLSNSVGHISHIPRTPPTPATFSIPSMMNRTISLNPTEEDIFGMIKLGQNDICYTSGTIEWVGRKRCFPINCGFKILNTHQRRVVNP